MDATRCDEVVMLLEQGWQDGVGVAEFRATVAHIIDCPACASTVRSWFGVDSALSLLAKAYAKAPPPTGISGRVCEALVREPLISTPVSSSHEFELARFLERLGREPASRRQIARAGSPAARLEVLVALAREQGFRFSEETVRQTLMGRQAANDGELSEAQLEAVAGGASAEFALLQALLDGSPGGGSERTDRK